MRQHFVCHGPGLNDCLLWAMHLLLLEANWKEKLKELWRPKKQYTLLLFFTNFDLNMIQCLYLDLTQLYPP